MFSKTAQYYDKIYSAKNYRAEVEKLLTLIPRALVHPKSRLLDAACGTGRHLQYLKSHFKVAGFDLDPGLIQIAREKEPEIPFFIADMTDFELSQKFEIITCLFSAIGYVKTLAKLNQSVVCLANHLAPNGVLIIEPWFPPDMWKAGTVHAVLLDEPELKIARVNTSFRTGNLSWFDLHYLIATPDGTEHFVERHELGLFTHAEMREAFANAGLRVHYDENGLTGRGLYIGSFNENY